MAKENEPIVEETEVDEVEELEDVEETDDTDWKAEAEKARGIAKRLKTKLEKAKEKKVEPDDKPAKEEPKTGVLDDNALDYLDLKGITEDEDIEIIQKVIEKTGQTVRQALKDEYVQSKLKANQEAREVKDAIPGNTKRSGPGGGNNLAAAVAKYKASGYQDLPEDFEMRSAVINAVAEESNSNKPAWK